MPVRRSWWIVCFGTAFMAGRAVLRTGEPEEERLFGSMLSAHPEQIAAGSQPDSGPPHRLLAGADLFLIPGCATRRRAMASLRYGTLPVVPAAGGLNDTIDEGTGFKFARCSGTAVWVAVREALRAFSQAGAWKGLILRGLETDFSRSRSAAAYSGLYRSLLGRA